MSAPTLVDADLTPDEIEILRCWRAMTVRIKIESLGVMLRNAELCLRIKLPALAPGLRLVSADGKAVGNETS